MKDFDDLFCVLKEEDTGKEKDMFESDNSKTFVLKTMPGLWCLGPLSWLYNISLFFMNML